MRLNGALKPHQGAPIHGCSTGAKKQQKRQQNISGDWKIKAWLQQKINNHNNKQIINKDSSNIGYIALEQKQKQQLQQQQQLEQKFTSSEFSKNTNNNNTKTNVKRCTCNNTSNSNNNTERRQQQTQQQPTTEDDYCHTARICATVVAGNKSGNQRATVSSTAATITTLRTTTEKLPSRAVGNTNAVDYDNQSLRSLTQLLLLPLLLLLHALIRRGSKFVAVTSANAVQMMRVQQSLMRIVVRKSSNRMSVIKTTLAVGRDGGGGGAGAGSHGLAFGILCLFSVLAFLPHPVAGDDGDNFFAVNSFSMGPETTTPEFGYYFDFDYASRGPKKFGDKCENTLECGFAGSICDPKKKSCQCTEDYPVTNHIDKCGKEASVNESCFFNEQCEVKYFQTECRDGRCVCRFEMTPFWLKDGSIECKSREKHVPDRFIDPAMIGILVGMALMFIIICVVLRLFAQARWHENRTIFNTPNPRLMNVSLLRDSKLLHGQERRGSRMSVRAPSRQPSMASLRPHSPNPSLGKTGSQNGSNSVTSVRSQRSNSVAPGNMINSHHERKDSAHHQRHNAHHHQQHQQHPQQQQPEQQHQQQEPLITNITTNPAAESVTVEIVVPEK